MKRKTIEEVQSLQTMSVGELRLKYLEAFGERLVEEVGKFIWGVSGEEILVHLDLFLPKQLFCNCDFLGCSSLETST